MIAAFVIFAVGRTKTASGQQVETVVGAPKSASASGTASASTSTTGGASSSGKASSHENAVHKAIDEASEKLTSPFAGVISSSSSEWGNQGVRLVLALLVYGLGFGYLTRVLLIRV